MRYDPIMCMMVDDSVKTQDVAPATQRYINTIVHENKANAEKFVRQAEQDDEVPENELKYVYKAYNEKFGYKFHDSVKTKDAKSYGKYKLPNGEIVEVIDRKNVHGADTIVYKNSRGVHFATVDWFMSNAKKVRDSNTIDKAIKAADGLTGDKLYADVKAIYNLFSNILLTYSNEQSVQKLANEGTKKCLELAAKVKGVRDEAIRSCDEEQFYQIRFGSGKIEGIKGDIDFVKQYVKDLMKKYGEKSAYVSQKGKSVFSYVNI